MCVTLLQTPALLQCHLKLVSSCLEMPTRAPPRRSAASLRYSKQFDNTPTDNQRGHSFVTNLTVKDFSIGSSISSSSSKQIKSVWLYTHRSKPWRGKCRLLVFSAASSLHAVNAVMMVCVLVGQLHPTDNRQLVIDVYCPADRYGHFKAMVNRQGLLALCRPAVS